jgi:hypothetical protein
MTTVDIQFRYAMEPGESVLFALSSAREVYGIRRLALDPAARTILVEYDATRLNGATVASLLRRAGLDLVEELPLIPQPGAEPAPAA